MVIKVKEIRGNCPVFKLGDRMSIDGPRLDLKATDAVCIHALPSLLYYGLALREGANPVNLGIGQKKDHAYIQCPDPGPPYTPGGSVVFEFILETRMNADTDTEGRGETSLTKPINR